MRRVDSNGADVKMLLAAYIDAARQQHRLFKGKHTATSAGALQQYSASLLAQHAELASI
jgi:hypothetical protein